ncbi:hypothetical protein D9611_011226 [Ephemerocybe angulata]|uniref:AB hydrolase-1 domain-containing protein n=1 Tax=Ephemerocybe angulata TaxID=980116 RepID=A0A8H5FK04_9AGAR|nr:hypothetical protein D9611_011226 [Tulosesus angulatus]
MALPVPNINGETHFAYLDSGAPNTPAYKTIFIVHGITFNAIWLSSADNLSKRDPKNLTYASPSIARVLDVSPVQDDNAKYGGDVNLEMFPKMNHFVHWDDPELAIASWKKALA